MGRKDSLSSIRNVNDVLVVLSYQHWIRGDGDAICVYWFVLNCLHT